MSELIMPTFRAYTNSESINFIDNALDILKKNPLPMLTTQIDELQKQFDLITASFKKESGSAKSIDLKDLDRERDRATQGIKDIAEAYLYHFDDKYVRAGDAIVRSMNKYAKSITRLGYTAQTTVINNLIEDWDNDADLQAAIVLLHLETWKTKLSELNETFNATYIARNEEEADKSKTQSATVMRKGMEDAYRELAKYLNANLILSATPELEQAADRLNTLIQKYNQQAISKPKEEEGEAEAAE